MQVLFIHQNFPGQFGRLAVRLAEDSGNTVLSLGEQKPNKRFGHPRVHDYWYAPPKGAGRGTHHYLSGLEASVRRGQVVYKALKTLKGKGFVPDVVYAHAGWGESLYVKDVFPQAKVLCFWEYFYSSQGGDFN